jgi:hypothetical protein
VHLPLGWVAICVCPDNNRLEEQLIMPITEHIHKIMQIHLHLSFLLRRLLVYGGGAPFEASGALSHQTTNGVRGRVGR